MFSCVCVCVCVYYFYLFVVFWSAGRQQVTSLLREKRDTVEMAMYKSGFLGGRPQGGIPPCKRWVGFGRVLCCRLDDRGVSPRAATHSDVMRTVCRRDCGLENYLKVSPAAGRTLPITIHWKGLCCSFFGTHG